MVMGLFGVRSGVGGVVNYIWLCGFVPRRVACRQSSAMPAYYATKIIIPFRYMDIGAGSYNERWIVCRKSYRWNKFMWLSFSRLSAWCDFFFLQNLVLEENVVPLHSQTGDQVAQSVEHIPFKDGVPGSSPGLVTREKKLYRNMRSAIRLFLFQVFLLFLPLRGVLLFCFPLRYVLNYCSKCRCRSPVRGCLAKRGLERSLCAVLRHKSIPLFSRIPLVWGGDSGNLVSFVPSGCIGSSGICSGWAKCRSMFPKPFCCFLLVRG